MEVADLIPVTGDGCVVRPPDLSGYGLRRRAAFRATSRPTGTSYTGRAVVGAVSGG